MKSYHFIFVLCIIVESCICTKLLVEKNYEGAICTGILALTFSFLLGYVCYEDRKSELRREKERKEYESIRIIKKEESSEKSTHFTKKDQIDDINNRLSFLEGYVLGIDALRKSKEN
jgi:hypothetical protein